jgi:hypothetical protein
MFLNFYTKNLRISYLLDSPQGIAEQSPGPMGRKGLQRKSFLPPGGKKIEAESPVFGPWGLRSNPWGPKRRTSFS